MDNALVESLIDRDWPAFVRACRVMAVGTPERHGQVIRIRCMPSGTDTAYLAILDCDGYNAVAPLLQFANPDNPLQTGREWWPHMANAPFNNIEIDGRHIPILCVKGTRGYHLHPSHCNEAHDRSTWQLVASATILHRLLHTWGPHQGRGV